VILQPNLDQGVAFLHGKPRRCQPEKAVYIIMCQMGVDLSPFSMQPLL